MNPMYRVDNRLVHGQIIATWMPHLQLQRVFVASDSVPLNSLQMRMFRMAIPPKLAFDALPLEVAAHWLSRRRYGMDRTLVLIESIDDALRLFEGGHPFSSLNIGNVHHAADRQRFTNAVYLGDHELSGLKSLMKRGVRIEIRSVPTEAPIDLRTALGD